MLPCAYKELFGIDCPTCGAQRSLLLLVEGNLKDSFLIYPPLIPVLVLAGLWTLKFLRPGVIDIGFAKKATWMVVAIVMINYVLHFFI